MGDIFSYLGCSYSLKGREMVGEGEHCKKSTTNQELVKCECSCIHVCVALTCCVGLPLCKHSCVRFGEKLSRTRAYEYRDTNRNVGWRSGDRGS